MSDRADRYAARLDGEIAKLNGNRARLWFLRNEMTNWEHRKARFELAINQRDFDPGDITIWDFALTIAEISVRLWRVECAMGKSALQAPEPIEVKA